MVTVIAWVFAGVMAVIPLLQVLACLTQSKWSQRQPATAEDYQMIHDLYAIRRRFDVAWLEVGLRRDTADARRALRAELDKLDRRERA